MNSSRSKTDNYREAYDSRSPAVDEAGDIYFEEQPWAVYLSLVLLCGLVVGLALYERPLEGDSLAGTAWPVLIGAPIFTLAVIAALAWLGNRVGSRSLQLSIVLGIMLHVALVAQMLHTRLAGSGLTPAERELMTRRLRPKQFVPDYHPTQFLPDEDRPRQDFEKPVETKSPEPADEPEQLVRQPAEEEQSPALPQPVVVPEQELTREPNVVERQERNEDAPRLAEEPSKLSRQTPALDEPANESVDLPASEQPAAVAPEVEPMTLAFEPQRAVEAASTEVTAPATDILSPTELPLARTTAENSPTHEPAAAPARPRVQATPADVAAEVQVAPPAAVELQRTAPVEPQPIDRSSVRRRTVVAAAPPIAAPAVTVPVAPTAAAASPAPSAVRRSTATRDAPAPVRESLAANLPRLGAANVAEPAPAPVEIPQVGPRSAVAQAEADHVATGARTAVTRRAPAGARPAEVAAPPGPGGLGIEVSPDVGVNIRQAQAEIDNVQPRAARFLRAQIGGLPAVSTAAVIPTEAFSSRAARLRGPERAGGRGSQSPQAEEAIELGLAFLARQQRTDGSWSLQGFPEDASLVSDTAATALAVLAFQGAGYNHRQFQYGEVVRGGLGYLLKHQKRDGDLFVPLDDASNRSVWLYSHSLAAIALCEAYGMTQDPALREPAQKAIDFIVAGQEAQRGGWRYSPGIGADTSVSGWMTMALKSGELAGLDVPETTYRKISRWLDTAQQSSSQPFLYRYNPYAPDTPEQRHGRTASKTMTAVGLLMRLYTGWQRDNPNMVRGAAYLGQNLPAIGNVRQPERDTYYWYYATQVMAQMGGEGWERWMNRLQPLLVNSQLRQGPLAGSWDPSGPVADRWGPHAGRLYVTAMNLLSLEVQYRKLPLYEDLAR